MTLQEIFDQLSYGELSQLHIGGDGAGVIDATNHAKVLAHVNLALTALYKRFNLKESSLVLELVTDKTRYSLNSKYAVSAISSEAVRYIKDSKAAPFKDDILKIERIYTVPGAELAVNDLDNPYAVSTPSFNVLEIPLVIVNQDATLPDNLRTATLKVIYRANHPRLIIEEGETLVPEEVEVELPDALLDPLLLFIASRMHTPGGMTGEFNAGNNYLAKYEAACQEIELKGLQYSQAGMPNRAKRGGWA